jgi:hypothetical protein
MLFVFDGLLIWNSKTHFQISMFRFQCLLQSVITLIFDDFKGSPRRNQEVDFYLFLSLSFFILKMIFFVEVYFYPNQNFLRDPPFNSGTIFECSVALPIVVSKDH